MVGLGSDQPVVQVLVDPYTLLYSHQFDLFGYHCELHGCCGQTKGQCFELVGPTLDMKMHVLPGLTVNWYVEVCLLEIYGSN